MSIADARASLLGLAVGDAFGTTRDGLVRAGELGLGFDVVAAGEELGTGSNITSRDTVPFSVWVAARHLSSYANALSLFAIDRGAIIGGIVASAVGTDGIPLLWQEATESLAVTLPA
jgi:hypothetical protein